MKSSEIRKFLSILNDDEIDGGAGRKKSYEGKYGSKKKMPDRFQGFQSVDAKGNLRYTDAEIKSLVDIHVRKTAGAIADAHREGKVPRGRVDRKEYENDIRSRMGLETLKIGPFGGWDEKDIRRIVRLTR